MTGSDENFTEVNGGSEVTTIGLAAIAATPANDAGTLAPTRMPARQNPCALSYTKELPCTP